MAYFAARDDKPADYCQARARDCDVYAGLIGLRYGSPVRDRPELSYTELEFDAATEAGVLRLVFLLDQDAALPILAARLLDADPGLQARQRAFRSRLLDAGVIARKVATPDQLELELLHALQDSQPGASARAGAARYAAGLPAGPDLVGRDGEVAALAGAWLATPPQPVPVLGAPGIGKSAVCLAGLHEERVRDRFGSRRWFVRCDGAESADALLTVLAAKRGVTATGSPGALLGQVCAALADGLAVVVLDNFETPWAADALRVEELLRAVAAVPTVAIAVSARGTARPAGLRWADFAMLSPLPLADARRMFLAVAGPAFAADPLLDGLLTELDGVPLAVELLGYAAQGQPDLADVAGRWQAERTGMLSRMGGVARELSVAVSIEASLTGPLMTAAAAQLAALLGVLPDGISRADLPDLQPGTGLAAAAVLRQAGLVFGEGGRLRMLAPVRDHIAAAHPPEPAALDRAVTHYGRLAAVAGGQVGGSDGTQAIGRVQAESGNISAMLEHAVAHGQAGMLADAIKGLAEYWRFTGYADPALARSIEDTIRTHGTPAQQAHTMLASGDIALARSDHDTALTRYDQALPLYQQVGSVLGEANCIQGLGDIALARSDHDTARARYQQALPLHQQVGDVLGEANCIRGLGNIALARSDHDTARDHYQQALPLYQRIAEPYSVGWTLVRLARLETETEQRGRHWAAARASWARIGRADLIESVKAEFE